LGAYQVLTENGIRHHLHLGGNIIGANIPLNSTHAGGVNSVFCGGSVKFLTNSTPLAVLAELATRDDGQILPDY
jgi:prepilin-type processing-associated H-X9-DG protein